MKSDFDSLKKYVKILNIFFSAFAVFFAVTSIIGLFILATKSILVGLSFIIVSVVSFIFIGVMSNTFELILKNLESVSENPDDEKNN